MTQTILPSRLDRQLALEARMMSNGVLNYRNERTKAEEKGIEASTEAGRSLLKKTIEPMAQALTEYLEANSTGRGRRPVAIEHLQKLSPETIAFLSAKSVLNSITKRLSLQNAAMNIGGLIEDELRLRHFQRENASYYQSVYNRIRVKNSYDYKRTVLIHAMGKEGIQWEAWLPSTKLQVGFVCVDLLIESTGLVEKVQIPEGKNKTPYYLVAHPKTLDWLAEEHEYCELLCPVYWPTIIPPKNWTSPDDGGYHSELAHRLKLVKTYNHPYLEELRSIPMPQVYQAINRIQKTPWKINKTVFEVISTLWKGHAELAGLPPRDNRTPRPCPFPTELKPQEMTEAQKATFKDWKREANYTYEQNLVDSSKRLLVSTILRIASEFQDEPEIFFPHMLDFRGRVYAVPHFLNPQGTDLAKSLLTFAHGKPIEDQNAADWLAIHGANVYGYDKVSLEERVQFIHGMNTTIQNIAADPMAHLDWTEADKPWQFLAFCFEWAGFLQEGFGFVSSLPVALDGSCNGLQHFSAMLRDQIGGEAVNLLPSDQPRDIYQRVADVTIEKLQDAKHLPTEEGELARLWLTFGVDRKLTKRPVMILPYGGTRFACREYIEAHIREQLEQGQVNVFATPDRERLFEASNFLAGLVWDSIGEVVVAARDIMSWLRQAASLAAKEELPINWITPSGFPVQQVYRTYETRRIQTLLSGSVLRKNYMNRMKLTLKEPTDKIDPRRQASGISPNFVHSMDAAALHLYVNKASSEGLDCFALVHDSYATLAADTDVSARCIRDVFVQMYQEDVLENFRESILSQLSSKNAAKLPPLPAKGRLDLEAVKDSAFFFA